MRERALYIGHSLGLCKGKEYKVMKRDPVDMFRERNEKQHSQPQKTDT